MANAIVITDKSLSVNCGGFLTVRSAMIFMRHVLALQLSPKSRRCVPGSFRSRCVDQASIKRRLVIRDNACLCKKKNDGSSVRMFKLDVANLISWRFIIYVHEAFLYVRSCFPIPSRRTCHASM